ncbi:MAG: hypothetical protein J6S14_14165 [Clostridia bacterium]|nr:hypothetical protein [Clostridia bacterium]
MFHDDTLYGAILQSEGEDKKSRVAKLLEITKGVSLERLKELCDEERARRKNKKN